MKRFYITTTLAYVNADPHIGFAMEIVKADVLARFKRLQGFEVIFNTGTDEHGLKIYRKAQEERKDPQKYCNEYAARFERLREALNLSYTNFTRTTDPKHKKAAQAFWTRCFENGDIYKKKYQTKYCVGCELEKTESELTDGRCLIHPGMELEIFEEENYFFRFSKYQQQLINLYTASPSFVVPDFRLQEIKLFVERGLMDFSISRLKEKMPWGVAVPGDPEHVMYVWFDALVNYISTIGWPENEREFQKWWPVVQIAGKDNLRQQCAIWQAMLMSAGLPTSKQILIQGFITSGGKKMSKSLGNVVNPFDLVNQYGVDAARYYLLREIPSYDDGDFSHRRFIEVYNADLANGLGNLVSRVAKLAENSRLEFERHDFSKNIYTKEWDGDLNEFKFDLVLEKIWLDISAVDKHINQHTPWRVTDQRNLKMILQEEIDEIRKIALRLAPFLPKTADNIYKQFDKERIMAGPPYFKRV